MVAKFLDLKTLSWKRRPLHCETMEKYELETLYSKKEKNYFTFNHVVSTYAIFFTTNESFYMKKVLLFIFGTSTFPPFHFSYNSRHSKLRPKLATCVGCLRGSIAKLHDLQCMIHLTCLRSLKTTLQYQTNLLEWC